MENRVEQFRQIFEREKKTRKNSKKKEDSNSNHIKIIGSPERSNLFKKYRSENRKKFKSDVSPKKEEEEEERKKIKEFKNNEELNKIREFEKTFGCDLIGDNFLKNRGINAKTPVPKIYKRDRIKDDLKYQILQAEKIENDRKESGLTDNSFSLNNINSNNNNNINNNNNNNNSNIDTSRKTVYDFFSNDPFRDEPFQMDFNNYKKIIDTELDEAAVVIASQILHGRLKFETPKNSKIKPPKLPVLDPEYISKYMRQSRGAKYKERECGRGEKCVSFVISSRYSDTEGKKSNAFPLREFLLPDEETNLLIKGIWPETVKSCILCNRFKTCIIWRILSNRDRNLDLIEMLPHDHFFTFELNDNSHPYFCIQDHGVSIRETPFGDSKRSYYTEDILQIDPKNGVILPFKKFEPKKLHLSVTRLEIDTNGTLGYVKCYLESDAVF